MDPNMIIKAAQQARLKAYAPYSQFLVGAAVLSASGKIVTGCNIENASYGLSMCAERTAIFKAISEGKSNLDRRFTAVAIVADQADPTFPCGACRQVLAEFCTAETRLFLADIKGEYVEYTLGELFPHPFGLAK